MDDIGKIQSCIRNTPHRAAIGEKRIAGIIGDAPSHYAKSPPLWNAVFRRLKIKATYLPFDVDESRLSELVRALKESDRVMGVNVTVPYKVRIMEYLDAFDEKAERIGAVNTIVRMEDGRLVGSNTDGEGFLQSIRTPRPGQKRAFVESTQGMDVLMIGAGGACRAVAFHLAEALGNGKLLICNRTAETARTLAAEVNKVFGNTASIEESEIHERVPEVGLIVNGSIKGQGGLRKSADGKATILEPYSALAPANPVAIPEKEYDKPEFYRDWLQRSIADIQENNRASLNLALSIPSNVGFCDLVYFPAETVFLRHGRLSGHRTLNGKGMIVAQAADALFHKICRRDLQKLGIHDGKTYERIVKVMYDAWQEKA